MARGRPVVIVQAACVLACSIAGSHAAWAQLLSSKSTGGLSLPGISLGPVTVAPTTLNVGSGGASVAVPGISVGGVITTSPTSISASPSGVSATLPSANVAGVATVSPSTVAVSPTGASVTLSGANVAGVASVAPTSVSVAPSGVSATLPSATVAGVAAVSSGSLSVSGQGVSATLPGANVANVVTVSPTSVSVSNSGTSVVVGGASIAGGAVSVGPTSLAVSANKLTVVTPSVTAGTLVTVAPITAGVSSSGTSIVVGGATIAGGAVSVGPTSLAVGQNNTGTNAGTSPAQADTGTSSSSSSPPNTTTTTTATQSAINQASPIVQLMGSTANAEAMAPVDQAISGLTFGDGASNSCAGLASAAFAPGSELNISAWNAASFGNGEREYQVNSDVPGCGSALSFQSLQRTFLPGTVVDASKAFGLKPGTLHFGFSGGQSESDTRVKATDAVRSAGFSDTGTTRLTSWSVGGYSLLTSNEWYAGTAVGMAWGQAQTENFLLASTSDYDTSGFVVASFVGKVVPLSDVMRVDLRGTLTFQRTVGEAHVDTVGVSYSDHVIQAADASISARLFGVFRDGDNVLRPFVQAGVTHHLRYDNRLEIDGVAYQLQEADTSLFTAAGLDFEMGRTYQFSIGVRHDYSPDQENLTGRIGFTARLN